ncbi:hypothetical protein G6F63_014218 [Rhizopus arrhizus]|nr:hypothetical protein G6F63_014218 [Rhizopus arrhizus]
MRAIHGRFPGRALAAPQVHAVAEVEGNLAAAAVAAAHLAADHRFGQAQAGVATGHRQAGQLIGSCGADLGLGLAQACIGGIKARVAGEAFSDQRVQLRVAQCLPPVLRRETGGAQVGVGQGTFAVQAVHLTHVALRGEAAAAGAGGQGPGQR